MTLNDTFNHPSCRYKLIWLAASIATVTLGWMGLPEGHAKVVGGLGVISTVLSAGVIFWYSILVGSGRLARAYFLSRDSRLSIFGEVVVVWGLTTAACAITVWMIAAEWSPRSTSSIVEMVGMAVCVFVAAMRSMDLWDKKSSGMTTLTLNRSGDHGSALERARHLMHDPTSTFPNTEVLSIDEDQH